jgi:hypothetical protein
MHIEFARQKSDIISKRDGSFIPKDQRQKESTKVEKRVKVEQKEKTQLL